MYKGSYPKDVLEYYSRRNINFEYPQEDLKIIKEPTDFLALNYYEPEFVRYDKDAEFVGINNELTNYERTEMNWIVEPGLYDLLVRLDRDYGKPNLFVSENGAAFKDVESDGSIRDDRRINYVREHLLACNKAIQDGVNLKGYFLWSFMDNFEWSFGYSKRFGIVHVDFNDFKKNHKTKRLLV